MYQFTIKDKKIQNSNDKMNPNKGSNLKRIYNFTKISKIKIKVLEHVNSIDKKQFFLKPFPLLEKVSNKQVVNNSKSFLKTLIDYDINSRKISQKLLCQYDSFYSPQPKKNNLLKKESTINSISGVYPNYKEISTKMNEKEKYSKGSYFKEKKAIIEHKKKNYKFVSLIDDKFFLNKISSFYGIRENKDNTIHKSGKTRSIFELTNSNIINIRNNSKDQLNCISKTQSHLQSLEKSSETKSRNKLSFNTLTHISHKSSKVDTFSSNKFRKSIKIKSLCSEELNSIKLKNKDRINLSTK